MASEGPLDPGRIGYPLMAGSFLSGVAPGAHIPSNSFTWRPRTCVVEGLFEKLSSGAFASPRPPPPRGSGAGVLRLSWSSSRSDRPGADLQILPARS